MKKLLPLLLPCLLCVNICFSQQRIEYANFIKTDTAVKWAAVYNSYVNLTPANPKLSIRNFYVNKLKKQGATVYIEDSASFAVTPRTINYDDYIASIKNVSYDPAKMNWFFNFDNKSDSLRTLFDEESNRCDTCVLVNKFSFYKIKQLLYYKNSQLQIRNLLLCPVIYKKMGNSSKESAEYFESGNLVFNDLKTASPAIPASAKFIGRACNDLVLGTTPGSETLENNIITRENSSLSFLLYKDIKKRLVKAYDTRISIFPDPKHMLDYRKIDEYQNEAVLVPEYDSTNVKDYKKVLPGIYFDDIYNYTLIQDFYFDFEKEKLYSKLVAFVTRKKVITSTGKFLGLTDYWGIVFPAEKKKVSKKIK